MWAFLLSITGPIVVRVLAVLGLGVVTYTGLSAVLSYVHGQMQAAFNGFGSDVVGLLFLSGTPQAAAMILSALAARLALYTMTKIGRLT